MKFDDVITVEKMWPEHKGHVIQIDELAWSTYQLKNVILMDEYPDGDQTMFSYVVGEHSQHLDSISIDEQRVYCKTCHQELPLDVAKPSNQAELII